MGEESVVLVLGDPTDPHIVSVCAELTALNCGVRILDAWVPWQPVSLTQDDDGTVGIVQNSSTIQITGVWCRLKPRLGGGLSEAEAFALRERREFLMALTTLGCGPAGWINDPWAQERARSKPLGLSVARRTGLRTPLTCISSDADRVSELANSLGGTLVYKPLTWLATMDGRVLFTNTVSSKMIVENRRAVESVPGMYQRLIPKRCEYRVTIVDERIFAVRIHSQERVDTALDWRRNQEELQYEACTLPSSLVEKLVGLVRLMGLRYAAIDLIETPEGEHVFLEANPGGNWLWLEQRLELPISRAIAEALITNAAPGNQPHKEPAEIRRIPRLPSNERGLLDQPQ